MFIEDRPACRNCQVYVIQRGEEGAIVGKIIAARPENGEGTLNVTLWDWTEPTEPKRIDGRAGGYGYNKLSAAMVGLKFAGVAIESECPKDFSAQLSERGYFVTRLL